MRTYSVTIRATAEKVIEVETDDENAAIELAHEQFQPNPTALRSTLRK